MYLTTTIKPISKYISYSEEEKDFNEKTELNNDLLFNMDMENNTKLSILNGNNINLYDFIKSEKNEVIASLEDITNFIKNDTKLSKNIDYIRKQLKDVIPDEIYKKITGGTKLSPKDIKEELIVLCRRAISEHIKEGIKENADDLEFNRIETQMVIDKKICTIVDKHYHKIDEKPYTKKEFYVKVDLIYPDSKIRNLIMDTFNNIQKQIDDYIFSDAQKQLDDKDNDEIER